MAKWSNLNPQSISELTPKEMRQAYSELRSIARKRADRLEAAGYKAQRFDPLNVVDRDDLEPELTRLASYLRSPGSRLMTARKEREQISIASRGYNIEDFDAFGDFMEAVRYRMKGRDFEDSDPYVNIYDAMEKRNMTVKTLQREFGKYLNYASTARELQYALESAPMETRNLGRLTAKNLQDILDKRGKIDALYEREDTAERDRRATERAKTKRKSGKTS